MNIKNCPLWSEEATGPEKELWLVRVPDGVRILSCNKSVRVPDGVRILTCNNSSQGVGGNENSNL